MADIDIQRKGPLIWPWILGLLVLGLLAWLLFAGGDDEVEVVDPGAVGAVTEPAVAPAPDQADPAGGASAALPAPVTEYMNTCTSQGADNTDMGREHQFTADCLERLAASLEAVIQREQLPGTDVSQRLDAVRQQARSLRQSDPQASTHAGTTRQAFTAAADLVEAVQQAGYREVAGLGEGVTRVRSAAQAVDANTPMLNQRDAVHNFFREAGETVRRIAETPASRG